MNADNSASSPGRSPFGNTLVSFRTRLGLTQERLARSIEGGGISPRSITNYERAVTNPKDWILPHRPALRLLSDALGLDMVDQHSLIVAWSESKKLRDAESQPVVTSSFITGGREDAIRTIMDAWNRTKNGEPGIVFVGGIAGIGKTELARHVSELIASSTDTVMITWGGASSWATNVEPYLAMRTAIDRLIIEPQESSTVPGRYPSRPNLGPEENASIMDSVPLLSGALISEHTIRALVRKQAGSSSPDADTLIRSQSSRETIDRLQEFCRLLLRLSQFWPIVLVLEDLHWAGNPTAALLLHLVQQMEQHHSVPILVIATYRTDEIGDTSDHQPHPIKNLLDTVGHSSRVRILTLNELMAPEAGMAFVDGLIHRTPIAGRDGADELVRWLYEKTSGHPLLSREMLRHLENAGVLEHSVEHPWEFDIDRMPNDAPDSISNFINQRLNLVSRRARRVLEIASAMDNVILIEIIAELMETDEEEISEIIDDELVETHQLLLLSTPVLVDQQSRSSYRFPHAVFQEHIYEGLSDRRRKRIHLAIGEMMEEHFTDTDTTVLAEITSHYVKAEDWHSAQMAGYRLAQSATVIYDWDLADVWFTQAEELAIKAKDPPQLWRTRAARLSMLRGTGRREEAVEIGKRILELADVHDWPDTLALTHQHMGELYYDLGQILRAEEHLTTAVDMHLKIDAPDLAAMGMAMLSHTTYRAGKFDVALKHAQDALELSHQLKNSWVKPEAVLAAANCEIDLGFYERAIANYQLASELASMVGKFQNQFIPVVNIGLCYTFMGEHQLAVDELTSLLDKMETLKLQRLSAHALFYLGLAYEGTGDWEAAERTFKEASRVRLTSLPDPPQFDYYAGMLRSALNLHNHDAIVTILEELTSNLDQHGWEGLEYPLMVKTSVARAYAYLGNLDEYRDYVERAHNLLMERADMIEDPASRESYLTNVPMNVDVQAMYDEMNSTADK